MQTSAAEAVDGKGNYRIFVEGDALYEAMIHDISTARRSVLLEAYIFREDRVGQMVLSALDQASRRGVSVRMRIDAFGSRGLLGAAMVKRLRRSGIVFDWSRRWRWDHPLRYNRRNHRKLLVIDNSAAYLGGFNFGDEYSLAQFGKTRWRDTHIRLTGPIIDRATALFHDFVGKRRCTGEPWTGESLLMPNYGLACRYRWRCLLQGRLAGARQRIWVTTPYFVPDRAIQCDLMAAAGRGVDVKLLLPGKSDVPLTQWAARASYAGLLEAGVKIFEYGPRMLHAKTILIDNDWSTIGTSNFDYRSFFTNYELNFISRSADINEALAAVFDQDLSRSEEVPLSHWSKRPYLQQIPELIGWIARRWL